MTISTAATPLSYAGNDATLEFAITWAYIVKSHVIVTLRGTDGVETVQVLDTNYGLTDPAATGTLTMVVAPATGETLVITLEPPNTQETDIPFGGSFPAKSVEDALDLASQVSNKLAELFNRTIRVPVTDLITGSDLEMPNETDRASKFLAFSASGVPVATAVTPTGTAIISAFAETYLDDANLGDTRATLNMFPAGTSMVFFQANAPTFWTQTTDHDDKALRVVSGVGGGNGGSVAFETAFASQTPTGNADSHVLTVAEMPAHSHNTGGTQNADAGFFVKSMGGAVNTTSSSTGGGGGHVHTLTMDAMNLDVSYIDLITATKD